MSTENALNSVGPSPADARRPSALRVGDMIPEQVHRPTAVQLFRYSAVTWNSHRIHYDRDYAAAEGYPGVLVQSHLHGAFLTQLCVDWVLGRGFLTRLDVEVRRFAVAGDELVCRGRITAADPGRDGSVTHVGLELQEVRSGDGEVCALGVATVVLLNRNAVPVPVPVPLPTADAG